MEALIGITGADYVLLAADRNAARSIVVMKSTEEKFRSLGSSVELAYCGEPGDATNFAEYVQGNVRLYALRNELQLGTSATAHYTRRLLADSLRSKVHLAFILTA
jgi:20S proteasome subunit beta 4